jgi:hypothetical protein
MDEPSNTKINPDIIPEKIIIQEVIVRRGFKDYVVESLLIVFSVLLALFLTELFNKFHEQQHTRDIIQGLKEELSENYRMEKEQYAYHTQIVLRIDSALVDTVKQKKFIVNGVIQLDKLIPQGVLLHDLNDIAWQVAKENNIISKIDLKTYGLLADIYANQERIKNTEPEIANVLLSRESRTAVSNRITLILLKDNYIGWAIGRAPQLIEKYRKALEELSKEN